MKKYSLVLNLCILGVLLAGCASNNGMVLNAVGPAQTANDVENKNEGTLVVYSAYSANADFNSRDPNRSECSDYKILSADGKLLQRVHNVTDDILQNPVPVNLPNGQYCVVAHANGHYGYVTVPVIIESGKNTVVHLEND